MHVLILNLTGTQKTSVYKISLNIKCLICTVCHEIHWSIFQCIQMFISQSDLYHRINVAAIHNR